IGEADARAYARRVVIVVSGAVGASGQAGEVELVDARGIDKRKLALIGECGVEISDVAKVVVKSAKPFGAQTEVQRQIRANLPVILREDSKILAAVLMVVHAAAAKAELRTTEQEVLEIGVTVRRVGEEKFAVEDLRKDLVQIDVGKVAAKAE